MASKKGGKRKFEEELEECRTILKGMQDDDNSEAFREPVDWEAYELFDYPEIIKEPMDLGTIEDKLNQGKYQNPDSFAYDVRLVWKNAMQYNRADSDIYRTAHNFSKTFEKKYTKLKKKMQKNISKSRKRRKTGNADAAEPRTVTKADRVKFSQLVNQLSSEELGQLVDKIQRECPKALTEEENDEVEIEINHINDETLLALNAFAEKCIRQKQSHDGSY